jgi:uracil DNA glycosylase
MLHLFAALAEKERAMISARTKAALAAAKERGVKLGNPSLAVARVKAEESRAAGADEFARTVAPVIRAIQGEGVTTLRGIARALVARKVETRDAVAICPPPNHGLAQEALTGGSVSLIELILYPCNLEDTLRKL